MPEQLSLFDIGKLSSVRRFREETRQETEAAKTWTWARDMLREWLLPDMFTYRPHADFPVQLQVAEGGLRDDAHIYANCYGDEAINTFIRFRVALGTEWCNLVAKYQEKGEPHHIYDFRLSDMRLLPPRKLKTEQEWKANRREWVYRNAGSKKRHLIDPEQLELDLERSWRDWLKFLDEEPLYIYYQVGKRG
jgi:hypothetical protein